MCESGCTLAFVNSWITKSTLPFVWDDPSSAEDVSTLAVDLANGAVRGKATEEAKTPLTACLVTANFDLQNILKYFSRLFVMKVVSPSKEKRPGDAKVLEDHAKAASSAMPQILAALTGVKISDVYCNTSVLKNLLPGADLRIQEGIAYPLTVAKLLLDLCGRQDMFEDVMDYVENTLMPYCKTCIGNLMPTSIIKEKEVGRFNVEVINGSTATLVKSIELAMKKETMAAFLGVQDPTDKVKALGGRINKTVRLEGKPSKCFLLPKTAFPAQTWEDFIKRIYGIDDEDSTEEQVELSANLNVPGENSLPVPDSPQDELDDSLPPPPPVMEEYNLDSSLPLPPPPPVMEEYNLDSGLPLPPPPVMEEYDPDFSFPAQEVMNDEEHLNIKKMAQLMIATAASPDNRCAKCNKVGRPGSLWVQCSSCHQWYHRPCTTLTYKEFKRMTEDSVWCCSLCS